MDRENEKQVTEESPPLLPSWNAWYLLVLGVLAVLILLFTLFSAVFS